jgi:hypothetical protein
MEDNLLWHYRNPDSIMLAKAEQEIESNLKTALSS